MCCGRGNSQKTMVEKSSGRREKVPGERKSEDKLDVVGFGDATEPCVLRDC